MKNILFILLLSPLASIANVAISPDDLIIDPDMPESSSLLPAGHSTCLNYVDGNLGIATCNEGEEFYFDQDGRCGCLKSSAITKPETCIRARISCDINNGFTFSSLYQYRGMCGMIQKHFAGCGCYSTDKRMHATSIR